MMRMGLRMMKMRRMGNGNEAPIHKNSFVGDSSA